MQRPLPFPVPVAAPSHGGRTSHGIAAGPLSASSEETGRQLEGLLREESALYAITRDWRFDVDGRKFVRLHRLLDEQFTEIGLRLAKLAARSRALDLPGSSNHGATRRIARVPLKADTLESQMIEELLHLHESMVAQLQVANALVSFPPHDPTTTKLLADLIAGHQKDAFMLRALLWEVRDTAT